MRNKIIINMEEKDNEIVEMPEEIRLPDNAYRELKEGEEYKPILLGQKKYPELNAWTISWGIIMAIIFSAATAYSGLRFGQVFEAAILKYCGVEPTFMTNYIGTPAYNILAIVMFTALCVYLVMHAMNVKRTE